MQVRVIAGLAIVLVVAGCTGPGPSNLPGDQVPTTTPGEDRVNEVPLVDEMTLSYRVAGRPDLHVAIEAAPVLDPFGTLVDGHLVRVGVVGAEPWIFGLGQCMTPLWGSNQNHLWFFESGYGMYLRELPGFLVRRDAPVPEVGDMFRVSEMQRAILNHSGRLLATGANGGTVVTHWAKYGVASSGENQYVIEGTWRQEMANPGTVPHWLVKAGENKARSIEVKSARGAPILPCPDFRTEPGHVMQQPLTSRATQQDPPLAALLSEAKQTAEADPTLTNLQDLLRQGDTWIFSWWGIPWPETAEDNVKGFQWTFTYGNPENQKSVVVQCDRTTGPDLPPVSPVTISCDEGVPETNAVFVPNRTHDFIADYEALFQTYRTIQGHEAVELRITFERFQRTILELPHAPVAILTGPHGEAVTMDAVTGQILDVIPGETTYPAGSTEVVAP